jgi:hypothetical protein
MKACTKCKEEKPLSSFPRREGATDGHRNKCKACFNLRAVEHYSTPEGREAKQAYSLSERGIANRRSYSLLTNYGITLTEYEALLEKQGGVCGICSRPPTDMALAVDHEHDMQERSGAIVDVNIGNPESVRGLLCGPCNMSLGGFQDSPELLNNAIEWLNKEK